MESKFTANITPISLSGKLSWKILAEIDKNIIVNEVISDESFKMALLERADENLERDDFVKQGEFNPDPETRFWQNPSNSKQIEKELNEKHLKNSAIRFFANKEEARVAEHAIFSIERIIKHFTRKANINQKAVQEEFIKALNKVI
ncbi:hypothetical protein IKB17_05745 [bacterium]|nr:hypothetical protein [bacterium]